MEPPQLNLNDDMPIYRPRVQRHVVSNLRFLFKAEQRKHVHESAKVILAQADRLIARLVETLGALEKARTSALVRTLAAVKN